MFKKIALVIGILFISASSGFAYDLDHSDEGYFKRVMHMEGRGVASVFAAPAEFYRTPKAEMKNHKWLWPVTSLPRTITNVIVRVSSGIYDVAFSPIHQIFSNDTTSINDAMGLPEYPWQTKEEDF